LSSHILNYEVEIELFNSKKRILVPDGEQIQPTITELHYDDRSRLFKASLLILSRNTQQTKVSLTGRTHPLISMPVLNTHLSSGDIIKPSHITWKNIRVKRTNYNTISSVKELVSKVARRPLIAGRIIRLSDVESLKLVSKGDFVTVQLRNATMSLSTRGISIESGSLNDIIRIKNPRSKKIIEAKVIAPNLTIIQLPRNIIPN
jgi:flagella basal body P-ring formation protein FlgA